MKRVLLVVVLVFALGVVAYGGFYFGQSSRDDEVTSLSKQRDTAMGEVEKWRAREDELKAREARAPKIPSGQFPEGYPKKVKVSSLPSIFDTDFTTKDAVAIAPGVWAELPEGASVADVARSGSLIGYCASIEAWEREYSVSGRSNTCA
jgi:hypothetical protein